VFIILLFEVNHFFLKTLLWVPPINPLNTYRLTILFLFALPGIKVRGARHGFLGAAARRQACTRCPAAIQRAVDSPPVPAAWHAGTPGST
jgi:hypothetical protein